MGLGFSRVSIKYDSDSLVPSRSYKGRPPRRRLRGMWSQRSEAAKRPTQNLERSVCFSRDRSPTTVAGITRTSTIRLGGWQRDSGLWHAVNKCLIKSTFAMIHFAVIKSNRSAQALTDNCMMDGYD